MIGIMQGRLSPVIENKIQAFPEKHWKAEFFSAQALGFDLIEWTLDRHNILNNPLFLDHELIRTLSQMSGVKVRSVTYDAAMQAPLVVDDLIQQTEVALLNKVLSACSRLNIRYLVFPLVDESSINTLSYDKYIQIFQQISTELLNDSLKIAIESDLPPTKLKQFIMKIGSPHIGINYDTGNSASLGYNFHHEMVEYSDLIMNIHIKDRKLAGPTVPLGHGDAPLEKQIYYFRKYLSDCSLVIQGARSPHGADLLTAQHYLNFITPHEA